MQVTSIQVNAFEEKRMEVLKCIKFYEEGIEKVLGQKIQDVSPWSKEVLEEIKKFKVETSNFKDKAWEKISLLEFGMEVERHRRQFEDIFLKAGHGNIIEPFRSTLKEYIDKIIEVFSE